MLPSLARTANGRVSSLRLTKSSKFSSSKETTVNRPVARSPSTTSTSMRSYGSHHHQEEAPKPYKRNVLSPLPSDAQKTSAELEREVKGLEGWLFGRKVTYIDPLKPIEDTPEQIEANGWLWNKKPLAPGETREWEEWEPITYIGTAICVAVCLLYLWAKPPTGLQTWANEEARERQIIRARKEYEAKKAQQEASL